MIEEIIKITEKVLLTLIGIATVFATGQEIYYLILQQKVQLADLLLLFIYTEVLGMVAIFYKSRRIPILLPLFIAITALSRMIILQGKGSDPQHLIYEAGAVLLLAIACFIVTHKNVSRAEDFDFNSKKSN